MAQDDRAAVGRARAAGARAGEPGRLALRFVAFERPHLVVPPAVGDRLGHVRPLALFAGEVPLDPVALAAGHAVPFADRGDLLLARPRPAARRVWCAGGPARA